MILAVDSLGRLSTQRGEVVLWKAPQQGRDAAQEIADGFDPISYPNDGPYFTTDISIAEGFALLYQAGLQEIFILEGLFNELITRGVIRCDSYYPLGVSYHVPASGLGAFNHAIQQGSANQFHPEK